MLEDKQIFPGNDILQEIEKQLRMATITILLISADYLTSSFITTKEIPLVMERRENDGLKVIPFIIKP